MCNCKFFVNSEALTLVYYHFTTAKYTYFILQSGLYFTE